MAFSPVRRPSARLTSLPACAQATKMIANISNNNLRKKRMTCYCAHPACLVFFSLFAIVLLVGLVNLNDAVPTSARRVLSEEKVISIDLFDVISAGIIFPVAKYFFKKVLVPHIRKMWEKVKQAVKTMRLRMKATAKKMAFRTRSAPVAPGPTGSTLVPMDSTRNSMRDDEDDSEKGQAQSEPTGSTRNIATSPLRWL